MPQVIHSYRPQRTAPEDLEAIFVAREPLLKDILARLTRWQPRASRQHYLIIGPRGIGKTNLLRLIEHRIQQTPKLRKKWHPVSIAEDAYGITRVTDLLIEALRILAEDTGEESVKRVYERVRFDDNEARVTDLSLDAFRRFHQSKGCGILLMVENVNRVFERQMHLNSEIHLLRKILIEEDWIMTICTSPTYLNAVTQPEEPLFEFFYVKILAELTPEQQEQMLQKLAALEGNVAFENDLTKFRPQLRALYHFTGGNPRLTILLYDLVASQSITDVKTELDLLLDQLTPFYQDRMKEIAEQEGKILETMALLPEGCTPTELAKEARMPGDHVRALLTRLEKAGYIRREERRQKRTIYIIPERFFRIWHQMNHSRAARGRVQYLLEFFASWYATKEERDQVWNELTTKFQQGLQLGDENRMDDLAEYMMYVAAVSKGSEKFEREFQRLRHIASVSGIAEIMHELKRLDREYRGDGNYFAHKGYFLANDIGLHNAALSAFRRAVELEPNDIIPLFNLAVALDKVGRRREARLAYEKTAIFLSNRKGFEIVDEAQDFLLRTIREDTDSRTVWIAAYLLGRITDTSIAGKVIEILQTSELPWRRQHCATALGLLSAKVAVPVLLEYLYNEADIVRGSAATALGRIGSLQAVKPLIECLNDEDSFTRGSAATALGRIGSEQAAKPLIECLKDEDGITRGSAAMALGRIGSEQAVDPLIECLKDDDSATRGSAAAALGLIGSEQAINSLIECLQDGEDKVRASAVTALGRIASEKPIPNLDQVLGALIKELADRPQKRVEIVIRALLRSAFRSANLEMVRKTINIVTAHFNNTEAFYAPYVAALEYIQSDKDPAVLERQHPEMRDAIQLLVNIFDEGYTNLQESKQKRLIKNK